MNFVHIRLSGKHAAQEKAVEIRDELKENLPDSGKEIVVDVIHAGNQVFLEIPYRTDYDGPISEAVHDFFDGRYPEFEIRYSEASLSQV